MPVLGCLQHGGVPCGFPSKSSRKVPSSKDKTHVCVQLSDEFVLSLFALCKPLLPTRPSKSCGVLRLPRRQPSCLKGKDKEDDRHEGGLAAVCGPGSVTERCLLLRGSKYLISEDLRNQYLTSFLEPCPKLAQPIRAPPPRSAKG